MGVKKLFLLWISVTIFLFSCSEKKTAVVEKVEEKKDSLWLNIDTSGLTIIPDTIKNGQTISHLLLPYKVSQYHINLSAEKLKDTFDLTKLRVNYPYYIVLSKDSILQYFVYKSDVLNHHVVDYRDTSFIYFKSQKEIEIEKKKIAGFISKGSSFSQVLNDSLKNILISQQIEDEIVNIYAWTIDFFHIQPNDYFKILYTQKVVEGEVVGLDSIFAVVFHHNKQSNYGFYFEKDTVSGYYNDDRFGLKKAFLKAPLKFTRISSGYTKRRFHPVQKRFKAHLGTDYAAPRGTPIWAVGDGTVTHAKYGKYNGNYVKIKHNATYTTQYLHMSKIAKGVRAGTRVKQGQIIGYVGSTGLASGPHLCYRFWKNGKQVNHRNESFEASEPIPNEMTLSFDSLVVLLKPQLDSIQLSNNQSK